MSSTYCSLHKIKTCGFLTPQQTGVNFCFSLCLSAAVSISLSYSLSLISLLWSQASYSLSLIRLPLSSWDGKRERNTTINTTPKETSLNHTLKTQPKHHYQFLQNHILHQKPIPPSIKNPYHQFFVIPSLIQQSPPTS